MNTEKQWWKSTTIQGQIIVTLMLALEVLRVFYGVSFVEKKELAHSAAA